MSKTLPLQPALDAAIATYQSGDAAAAAIELSNILAHRTDDPVVLRLYGLALVRSGEPQRALPYLARARRLARTDPLTHLHLGIGLAAADKPARAAAALRHAATLAPNDAAIWINFATVLLSLDRAAAARGAARRAVALAPDHAESQYTLGLADLACGDPAPALAAFEKAVTLRPRFADAWVNLGIAAYRLGNASRAAQAMHQALSADPHHRAAEANLAAFMLLAGEAEAAITRLREALKNDPANIAARLNLANLLLLEGESREALNLLDGEPPAHREGRQWLAHRATAQIQLSHWEDARRTISSIPPPYLDAELPVLLRRLSLAVHDHDGTTATDLASRIARWADLEEPLPEHRIVAHFDLARFHQHQGRTEEAFAHWTGGHRILARYQPFSREGADRFLASSISRFDKERLWHGARADNRDTAPVFIVGMPRSGTTLTEQILSAHRDVHGAGERIAMHQLVTRLGAKNDPDTTVATLADLDAPTLTREAEGYLSALHALRPEARYVVDKMPGNALHLGFISTLLPGARIVVCSRDPRDVGLSIFQLRFFGFHPYAHDLADLGWYLGRQSRLMEHWRTVVPLPIMTIDLADWVTDFNGTLVRLLGFLELEHDPACERFYENKRRVRTASAAQVRQPINARGLGRWRAFAPQLAPMLDELKSAGLC